MTSIHFYISEYQSYKEICSKESYRSTHYGNTNAGQKHVSEEESSLKEAMHESDVLEIVTRVEKDVETSASRTVESKPPPSMVFAVEMEIDNENGHTGTDDQNVDEDDGKKPKDVVILRKEKN